MRLKDGRTFPAKVVGTDDKTDIAVLKIEAKDLPVAEFGDSDKLRVGQLVCAIGAPFNQDYSFTVGWVSGKGRTNLLGPTLADDPVRGLHPDRRLHQSRATAAARSSTWRARSSG